LDAKKWSKLGRVLTKGFISMEKLAKEQVSELPWAGSTNQEAYALG
jgi:hypothetical protein